MGDENEMKGKGAVGEGTWMLSPEHPSCSPEALGTTTGIRSLLLLTWSVGVSVKYQYPALHGYY